MMYSSGKEPPDPPVNVLTLASPVEPALVFTGIRMSVLVYVPSPLSMA